MEALQIKPTLSRTFFIVLAIAFLTAFASEIKVMPFENAPFRFGLGSIIFFLALLIQRVPMIATGIITGGVVVLFRATIENVFFNESFFTQLLEHSPAACFYILFAAGLSCLPSDTIKTKPLALGLIGALLEILANSFEHLVSLFLDPALIFVYEDFAILCAVAFLRSFFVVGIYSGVTVAEQKKQLEQLLTIGADLYVESLYLHKSMDQIEGITSDSYQLYRKLKLSDPSLASDALRISQEIHEVKKDSARIYAGLSKIVTIENQERFDLIELLQYVVATNNKYSAFLKKDIQIIVQYSDQFYTSQHLALLGILNNLVSNAIEAIESTGTILITTNVQNDLVHFHIRDNGPGIQEHLLPVIFEPGYTSKFYDNGFASTGIGLSHVQTITERLQGTVSVTSEQNQTEFIVILPLQILL